MYKFAPGKAIEGRFRFSQVALNDTAKDITEPEWQDRDYLYDQYTMSLRLDIPLIKRKLFFQGRYDHEVFSDHGDPGRFRFAEDEYLSGGFSLLRYDQEKFSSILSFSREPL